MYVFAAGPLLGIVGDVEYEDYMIAKFPFFYRVFPNAPSEPVKLPTVNYSDFGFPDLHITLRDPPKWTLTTEVSTAVLLHCAFYFMK